MICGTTLIDADGAHLNADNEAIRQWILTV